MNQPKGNWSIQDFQIVIRGGLIPDENYKHTENQNVIELNYSSEANHTWRMCIVPLIKRSWVYNALN